MRLINNIFAISQYGVAINFPIYILITAIFLLISMLQLYFTYYFIKALKDPYEYHDSDKP